MISGLHVQYFLVCKRKLWLYSKQLGFEEGHEKILEGKILHDRSYNYADRKELMVEDSFKVDVLDGEYVREIKLSRKMTEADRYQLLYYLYQLKKRGLIRKGLISYTKERRTEEIVLTEEEEKKIQEMEHQIEEIIAMENVPKLTAKPYCKSCAYFDFCFAGGEEEV
ncbi:MAG: CRISPR-associated protein Cas4 [Bacillaceae bacterium]|nr:CRISPR-associated protein Cas4 [Bacillaceae bacterium]